MKVFSILDISAHMHFLKPYEQGTVARNTFLRLLVLGLHYDAYCRIS